MAVVFDHAGQPDSAAVHYERFIEMPHPRRLWQDSYWLASSHERLAEIYEVRSELGPALRHAVRFIELWENADPLLRSSVEAKRALLARLQERRAS